MKLYFLVHELLKWFTAVHAIYLILNSKYICRKPPTESEGDEPEHALLLVRDAHVVDGPVDAVVVRWSRSEETSALVVEHRNS